MSNPNRRDPSVVIIGSGMAGILMTIRLREEGIHNITILEKASEIGGTWRENTYPGVSCDVPAHMYAYSFEPNTEWDERFASGKQLFEYFKRTADKYGVTNSIRFNEAVTSATYRAGKWLVETSKGNKITADFVVCATGILHHPSYPDIPGLEDFKGTQFHTARWNHDTVLEGKKLGIIGTGSTAAQVIPEIVKVGKKVSVFQRTPQWIYPRPDRSYSDRYKRTLARFPFLAQVIGRYWAWFYAQMFARSVIGKPFQSTAISVISKLYLRTKVKNRELRKKLTPNYRVGCKRMVLATGFYEAVQEPNCELVTDNIDHIEEKGVVTKDGRLHELDVLILSTGFHHFNFMRPMNLVGKNGVTIEDEWKDRYVNYRSVSIPNFPNFFLMTGPNSPIGNYSVTMIAEVQTDYVLKMIDKWRDGEYDEIDAKESSAIEFMDHIKDNMGKTVWTGGCQSWYLDQSGSPVLWPFTFEQWVDEMAVPEFQNFHTEKIYSGIPTVTQAVAG